MVTRRHLLAGGAALACSATLAGCSGILSDDGPFEFETVAFTDGQPEGMDDYDEQPGDTYAVDDTIWLLVRVHHVPVDSAGTARLVYTFEIGPPDGSTWDVDDREESWDRVSEHHILAIWEPISTFEDGQTGEYELALTVEDQVDGETIRATETFTLEQN